MNWAVVIIVGILAIGLLVFTIVNNLKDEKDFEQDLNNDFENKRKDNGDIVTDGKEV